MEPSAPPYKDKKITWKTHDVYLPYLGGIIFYLDLIYVTRHWKCNNMMSIGNPSEFDIP
jgi:hypothetical protein